MSQGMTDYARWHHLMIRTRDIDPHYDVLRHFVEQMGPEEAGWLVLRHVAYYHLGSAMYSFSESPGPVLPDSHLKLPTSQSRRNHRTPAQLRKHWDELVASVDNLGGPVGWLTPPSKGVDGWREMIDRSTSIHGNGRYFAYKVAEISQKVMGAPITAPDAGHAHSSGPRKGLQYLVNIPKGNRTEDIARLDKITESVGRKIGEPDIAQVETSLCAWQAAVEGRCYIGMYIDEQLEELHHVTSDLTPVAYQARAAAIPKSFLGEASGWEGVRRDRMNAYKKTGRIVVS